MRDSKNTNSVSLKSEGRESHDFDAISNYYAATTGSSFNYNTSLSTIPPVSTSSVTLFTPTTLLNIEQTLLDLQNSANNSALNTSVDTVLSIRPTMTIKSEVDDADVSNFSGSDVDSQDSRSLKSQSGKFHIPDIDPSTYLVANSRRPTGPRKPKHNEDLSTEEDEKRKQRRERNKQAAAKCRKRREDHAQILINETEELETEKNHLEQEITSLQTQKEQLEFLLQAHQATNACHLQNSKRHKLEPTHFSPLPVTTSSIMNSISRPSSTFRPNSLPINNMATSSSMATTRSMVFPQTTAPSVSEATGVPVETPSTGLLNLGLYAMVDGHTGLTPLTGVIPFTPTIINTPTRSSGNDGMMTPKF